MNIKSTPRFGGVLVNIGGQRLFAASLTLRQFKDNYEALTLSVDNESVADQLDRTLPVILLALQRNYPELTLDDLQDGIDLASYREILLAAQGASGVKAITPGE